LPRGGKRASGHLKESKAAEEPVKIKKDNRGPGSGGFISRKTLKEPRDLTKGELGKKKKGDRKEKGREL